MNLRLAAFLATVVMTVFLVGISVAQTSREADLLAVDSAFVAGQYEQVELLALRVLQNHADLTADEIARVNLTAGYALIMLGRESDARRCFERALDAVPDLVLDPVQVSPKFRTVFYEVKAAHFAEHDHPVETSHSDVARAAPPAIRRAVMSNLLIPGSGFWKLGHPVRGAIWFSVEAAAVTVLIVNLIELQDSRADYMAETDLARVRRAYDKYNKNYQAAWIAGVGAATIYVLAQADLVRIGTVSAGPAAVSEDSLPGVGVRLRW